VQHLSNLQQAGLSVGLMRLTLREARAALSGQQLPDDSGDSAQHLADKLNKAVQDSLLASAAQHGLVQHLRNSVGELQANEQALLSAAAETSALLQGLHPECAESCTKTADSAAAELREHTAQVMQKLAAQHSQIDAAQAELNRLEAERQFLLSSAERTSALLQGQEQQQADALSASVSRAAASAFKELDKHTRKVLQAAEAARTEAHSLWQGVCGTLKVLGAQQLSSSSNAVQLAAQLKVEVQQLT
jgi:chromosome segregation ATPase